ncbi:MAG TPA: (2Fe-2S)-binding protein [Thermoanaerobaculia bacterium]|jgi:aerobic-type carbon monoxide dehydrogenase small subunit (CoxS/CutS family)
MSTTKLLINGKSREVQADPDTPLLWVLRDELELTGTKYGCGMGLCGACTVHADGEAIRSCSVAISDVKAKKITTIEGLSPNGTHPLQRAWAAENVPQCGYCQPGQIMSAAALLSRKKGKLTTAEIEEAMSGNLCRCGTYQRIQKAILRAAGDRAASEA